MSKFNSSRFFLRWTLWTWRRLVTFNDDIKILPVCMPYQLLRRILLSLYNYKEINKRDFYEYNQLRRCSYEKCNTRPWIYSAAIWVLKLFSSDAFFFYVRIRTKCLEHVNSFIDAYWAHVTYLRTCAQYASMNEFTCSGHFVRIRT